MPFVFLSSCLPLDYVFFYSWKEAFSSPRDPLFDPLRCGFEVVRFVLHVCAIHRGPGRGKKPLQLFVELENIFLIISSWEVVLFFWGLLRHSSLGWPETFFVYL